MFHTEGGILWDFPPELKFFSLKIGTPAVLLTAAEPNVFADTHVEAHDDLVLLR